MLTALASALMMALGNTLDMILGFTIMQGLLEKTARDPVPVITGNRGIALPAKYQFNNKLTDDFNRGPATGKYASFKRGAAKLAQNVL